MFMILYAATDQSAVWGSTSDCQSTPWYTKILHNKVSCPHCSVLIDFFL